MIGMTHILGCYMTNQKRLIWLALRVRYVYLIYMELATPRGDGGRRACMTSKSGLMVNVCILMHLAYTEEITGTKYLKLAL